ncbi:hypothetical protein CVT24_001323 [Panaeolus cyanescens]|uniref:Uncharacterized protein n=1 Tax=Panaeolus cyanescens TaxID=181874 RepID=A0A409WXI5_9AGAR|nr:hypothetical protein CVT24_001323 [Panaeolus cyanescens]
MSMNAREFSPSQYDNITKKPIGNDNTFSNESPWHSMFGLSDHPLLQKYTIKADDNEAIKIQDIIIYGGYRLTRIVDAMKAYVEETHSFNESKRRNTWMQIGLLHELQFFQSFLGLGISVGLQPKVPPIYSLLGQIFGLRTTHDVPEQINFADLDDPLFCSWRVPSLGLLGGWWADPDFNMADPHDYRNKTRLIRMEDLFQHISEFRMLQADMLQTHHRSQTESAADPETHSSRRAKWKMPRLLFEEDQGMTVKESKLEDWPSLSTVMRGRSWAPVVADADLEAGVHYLGDADFRRNRGEWPMKSASDVAWARFDSGHQGLYLKTIGTDHDIARAPHGFASDDPITRDLYPWKAREPLIPSSSLVSSTNPADVMEPYHRWLTHQQVDAERTHSPPVHHRADSEPQQSPSHNKGQQDGKLARPSVRFASPVAKLAPQSDPAVPSDRFSQLALHDSEDDADDEEDELPERIAEPTERARKNDKKPGSLPDGGMNTARTKPSSTSMFGEMADHSSDSDAIESMGGSSLPSAAAKTAEHLSSTNVSTSRASERFREMADHSSDEGMEVGQSNLENAAGNRRVKATHTKSHGPQVSTTAELCVGSVFAEMNDDSDGNEDNNGQTDREDEAGQTRIVFLPADASSHVPDEDANAEIVKSVFAEMMDDSEDDEEEDEVMADRDANVFASMLLDDDETEDMQWDTESAYPLDAMPDEPNDESEDV